MAFNHTHPAASLVSNDAVVLDEATSARFAQMIISGNTVLCASNGAIVMDGVTLDQGAPMTISDIPVSLGKTTVAVGSKTYGLQIIR